ncbi:hypothetical protein C5S36_11180, partial [Candidatus Methanophagaceae archaeon]
TGWNSLMISSFALGYQVLHDKSFLDAATSATQFILDNLSKEGQYLDAPEPVKLRLPELWKITPFLSRHCSTYTKPASIRNGCVKRSN